MKKSTYSRISVKFYSGIETNNMTWICDDRKSFYFQEQDSKLTIRRYRLLSENKER